MNDIFISVLSIIIMIYLIMKNRKTLKKLTRIQLFGVVISYLVTIFVVFCLIYYGGNWITGQFSYIFFKYIIFIAVVCIVLFFCGGILRIVLEKITNGVLPKK